MTVVLYYVYERNKQNNQKDNPKSTIGAQATKCPWSMLITQLKRSSHRRYNKLKFAPRDIILALCAYYITKGTIMAPEQSSSENIPTKHAGGRPMLWKSPDEVLSLGK